MTIATEAIAPTRQLLSQPAELPVPTLTPISSSQRLALLDVLRGFALIGILLMNIEWFSRPISQLGMIDRSLIGGDFITGWLVMVLVEGKFYKLFSLLFGMGLAVMLMRAQEHGRAFGVLYSRRMAALFLFGMLHASLLWAGDILRAYAIGGLLVLGWLVLLRKPLLQRFSQPRSILRLSVTMMALPFLLMFVVGTVHVLSRDSADMSTAWQERAKVEELAEQRLAQAKADGIDLVAAAAGKEDSVDVDNLPVEQRFAHLAEERATTKMEREQEVQAEITALTQPDFAVATAFRTGQVIEQLPTLLVMALFDLFPLFLFGYWLIASGRIRSPEQHLPFFRTVAYVGIGVGLLISAASVSILFHPASRNVTIVSNAAGGLVQLSQSLLAAGYLGLFVCAMQSRFWQGKLAWLAPMGRMALTNYLMHSLILSWVFYGYGMAQYGHISRAEQLWLVLAIIPAQWLFSRLWLSQFRYGPLEWLWRCITYWRWQPLRMAPESAGLTAQ